MEPTYNKLVQGQIDKTKRKNRKPSEKEYYRAGKNKNLFQPIILQTTSTILRLVLCKPSLMARLNSVWILLSLNYMLVIHGPCISFISRMLTSWSSSKGMNHTPSNVVFGIGHLVCRLQTTLYGLK